MKYLLTILISLSFLNGKTQTKEDLDALHQNGKINLIPMYGNSLVEKAYKYEYADEEFMTEIEEAGVPKSKASKELVLLGMDFFYRGQLQTAMKRFNQAWLIDSNNPGIYFGFWLVQEVIKQPEKRTEFYGMKVRAIQSEMDPSVFYKMGEKLDVNNEYEKYALDYGCSSFSLYGLPNLGIENCEKKLVFNPDDTLAYQNYADILSDMESWQKSLEIQFKSLKYRVDKWFVFNDIAWNYEMLGKTDSALVYYQKSIEISSNSYFKPRINYCLLKEKTGNCENSVQYIDQCIDELPKESFFYFIKGRLLLCLNQKDEAENNLKLAKKLGSNEAKLLLKELKSNK
ncbi:hypothetical protein ERX46_07305 [Brumimicrobium glaciale]|uniref:Tetratricopeptide repeat protein n=1 Tax=Brumimicrobium glaciale TaxID=200475 RepID=A0A4Q4KM04_9FLAO|nr:hypothetical protein [Brumimicrobium glaciale]RYM33767.1 hypothetical protein ERX46_07305 [Brumimicrobium glaciale]